jgi:hypothetical protein
MAKPLVPKPTVPSTRVDRFVLWAKNNRVVAALLIVGLVVGAVGTFTESLKKTAATVAELLGAARGPSEEELATQAQVQQAAQRVDAFFARALGEQVLDFRHPTRDEYQEMQSALQILAVTFNAQNQPDKAKTVELAMGLLKRLWTPGNVDPRDWQIERLRQQREEWVAVFKALGHPLPGLASKATAP